MGDEKRLMEGQSRINTNALFTALPPLVYPSSPSLSHFFSPRSVVCGVRSFSQCGRLGGRGSDGEGSEEGAAHEEEEGVRSVNGSFTQHVPTPPSPHTPHSPLTMIAVLACAHPCHDQWGCSPPSKLNSTRSGHVPSRVRRA
jgi:hypothetical protein